jgi:hypothetical protein
MESIKTDVSYIRCTNGKRGGVVVVLYRQRRHSKSTQVLGSSLPNFGQFVKTGQKRLQKPYPLYWPSFTRSPSHANGTMYFRNALYKVPQHRLVTAYPTAYCHCVIITLLAIIPVSFCSWHTHTYTHTNTHTVIRLNSEYLACLVEGIDCFRLIWGCLYFLLSLSPSGSRNWEQLGGVDPNE